MANLETASPLCAMLGTTLLCCTEFALCLLGLFLYPKTLQVWHLEMGPALYSHLQAVDSPVVTEPSQLLRVVDFLTTALA